MSDDSRPTARPGAGGIPLALAVASISALVLGPALAYLEVVEPLIGFGMFGVSGLVALVAVVAGAVSWRRSGRSVRAITGMCLALVPLATFGYLFATRPSVPPINDITTDLDDPPIFVAALERAGTESADLSFPDGFAEPIRAAYGDLRTQVFSSSPEQTLEAVREIVRELGWQDVRVSTWNHDIVLVEGVAISGVFRFRDDVVIRIDPISSTRLEIDVRSRSRVGRSDLGVNADRIRRVQAALRERLTEVDSP